MFRQWLKNMQKLYKREIYRIGSNFIGSNWNSWLISAQKSTRRNNSKYLVLLMERKCSYKDNGSNDKSEYTRNYKKNISDIDSNNNMKLI